MDKSLDCGDAHLAVPFLVETPPLEASGEGPPTVAGRGTVVDSWKNPERHYLLLSGSPRLSLRQRPVGSLGNESILQISVVAFVQTLPSRKVPSGLSVLGH